MFQFGERHPVLFEIVLVMAAFLAAGFFSLVGAILNVHPALSSSVGRVLIGAALIVIYNRAFTRGLLRTFQRSFRRCCLPRGISFTISVPGWCSEEEIS